MLLVVMMILLTATALAGVSLQATQYELRAAGFDRSAVQTQYISETAMATTLSWVDATSMDGSIKGHIAAWNDTTRPDVTMFGEPPLSDTNRIDTSRTMWKQQARLTNVILPPITVAGADKDPVGTFGPKSQYHPGTEDRDVIDEKLSDYVVDMYDCQRLTGAGSPGTQVNQTGSGTIRVFQLYCVITARGRSFMFGSYASGTTKIWKNGQGKKLEVSRYAIAHDSRGTILSPPIVR